MAAGGTIEDGASDAEVEATEETDGGGLVPNATGKGSCPSLMKMGMNTWMRWQRMGMCLVCVVLAYFLAKVLFLLDF
jgi:hypothetical protein